jgi:hypothetical protein
MKLLKMKYSVDIEDTDDSGGYCVFYNILEDSNLGFKQYGSKTKAETAYAIQKELSRFDLAPKVVGKVCRLPYEIVLTDEDGNPWIYKKDRTLWGYITQKAETLNGYLNNPVSLKKLQNLVNNIQETTGLKFWDCHYGNVGFLKKGKKKHLVCIDTGKESFNRDCNAWGFGSPGPKCNYCDNYQCVCSLGVYEY